MTEALAERERLAQMVEQAPGLMAMLEGADHVFTRANAAFRRFVGERPLIGLSCMQALPEAMSQDFANRLDRVFASGETERGVPVALTLSRPGAAPERRTLEFILQPIRDAGGRISGVFLAGSDVSESTRAAEALRASEAGFRSFLDAIPNHLWTAAPNGMGDWFNAAVHRFTGVGLDKLKGVGWASYIHPDDLQRSMISWAQAQQLGEIYETDVRFRRHDGVYRWHLIRAVPVRGENGEITRWVGGSTDIQDQKDVSALLESRVAERSRQLDEAQEALRQAQKMEALGQLTGGVAHDFNNLLQTICGAHERLRARLGQGRLDEVDRFLKVAEDGASRAAQLTHRLLAFSRRQTLAPRALDLNRLVAGMEASIRDAMGPQVRIEVALQPDLWTIRSDANQLENALLNLCINARDAMPGGGRLTIETRNCAREAGGQDQVALTVGDDGAGMPEAVRQRAFEPFFTTKPQGRGTGLGLALIQGFMRQSGGEAHIASEPGEGARVTLLFPRHFGVPEPLPEVAALSQARGAGQTVLVVEDEDSVRELAVEMLEEIGFRAFGAGDGRSALDRLAKGERVELMIIGLGLSGGLSGRQLAQAARRRRPDLPVLFITGLAEDAAPGDGAKTAQMAKPFALSALGAKVREMLAGAK